MGSVKLLILLACTAALVHALPKNYEQSYDDEEDAQTINDDEYYPAENLRDERETELTKKVDYTVNKIFHVLERFCQTFKFKFCKSREPEMEPMEPMPVEPMPVEPMPLPVNDNNFLNYDNMNNGYERL